MNPGINIVTPFVYDTSDGPYKTTKNSIEAVKQNLKVLFLTNPGERIMNLKYGIGIKRFLFENISQSLLQKIHENIYDQISRFMPYVKILKLETDFERMENAVKISLSFSVDGLMKLIQLDFIAGK